MNKIRSESPALTPTRRLDLQLVQIEHALAAVNQGETSLGVKGTFGVEVRDVDDQQLTSDARCSLLRPIR